MIKDELPIPNEFVIIDIDTYSDYKRKSSSPLEIVTTLFSDLQIEYNIEFGTAKPRNEKKFTKKDDKDKSLDPETVKGLENLEKMRKLIATKKKSLDSNPDDLVDNILDFSMRINKDLDNSRVDIDEMETEHVIINETKKKTTCNEKCKYCVSKCLYRVKDLKTDKILVNKAKCDIELKNHQHNLKTTNGNLRNAKDSRLELINHYSDHHPKHAKDSS